MAYQTLASPPTLRANLQGAPFCSSGLSIRVVRNEFFQSTPKLINVNYGYFYLFINKLDVYFENVILKNEPKS